MKIIVDRSRCTGLGICEALAPEHFEVDESGDLVMLQVVVTDAQKDDVVAAIEACPTESLRLAP